MKNSPTLKITMSLELALNYIVFESEATLLVAHSPRRVVD
ncbi:hypothetical protein DSUL_160127 [Desulfovibrionales bacterium]